MTEETADAIRETQILDRLNTITPGEWRACAWDPMERPHVTQGVPARGCCRGAYDLPRSQADAAFIAAAPADVGFLLARIDALRAELENWKHE